MTFMFAAHIRPHYNRMIHVCLGNISVKQHGIFLVVATMLKSVVAFPGACMLSLVLWIRKDSTFVFVARNGHANASHFLQDFVPLSRAKGLGEYGAARVVCVADYVPMGKVLWSEIQARSSVLVPQRTQRLFRLAPRHRFLKRFYLPLSDNASIRVPTGLDIPSRFLDHFSSEGRVSTGSGSSQSLIAGSKKSQIPVIAMQSQRPEMYFSLQRAAGRLTDINNGIRLDSQFAPLAGFYEAKVILERQGVRAVDLWRAVGDPAALLPKSRSLAKSEKLRLDNIQTRIFSDCDVFLSNASGSWWIAWALGKPTVAVNSYGVSFRDPISLLVPVLLWDKSSKRFLRISEMFRRTGAWHHFGEIASHDSNLEVIYNEPSEIADAAIEMTQLVQGQREFDTELQRRVASILAEATSQPVSDTGRSMWGQSFLGKHPEIVG